LNAGGHFKSTGCVEIFGGHFKATGCVEIFGGHFKTAGAFSYLLLWAFYPLQCDSNSNGKDPIPLVDDAGTYHYG
jgi:hypothetical protein